MTRISSGFCQYGPGNWDAKSLKVLKQFSQLEAWTIHWRQSHKIFNTHFRPNTITNSCYSIRPRFLHLARLEEISHTFTTHLQDAPGFFFFQFAHVCESLCTYDATSDANASDSTSWRISQAFVVKGKSHSCKARLSERSGSAKIEAAISHKLFQEFTVSFSVRGEAWPELRGIACLGACAVSSPRTGRTFVALLHSCASSVVFVFQIDYSPPKQDQTGRGYWI